MAFRIAGQLEESLRGGGVGGESFWGSVIGNSPWCQGLGYRFISTGDFVHNRLLIEGKGKGPANPDVLKGGSGYVEAIKVGSEKWAGVKIGSATEMG
jgi:hypothetical protein